MSFFSSYNNNKNYEEESDSFLFLSKTEGLISVFWRTPVIPSRIGQKKRTARDGLLVIVCFNRWVTSKRYISLPLSLSLPLVQNNNASGTTRSPHRVRT